MNFLKNPKLIFWFLVLLLVLSKLITLLNISFVFTGGDDLIFWQMAKDYGRGIFQEPFMYGQNYNYAIESFFSVPLLKLGVPYQYALPIVTSLLGIFPFVMFGYGFFKKEMFLPSYLWLVIPIAMPIEYDIMTTITRGFINGLFFTSFLVFPLLSVHKSKSFILFGLFVALGYVTNPNSLVFSFPIGVYLFLHNFKNYKFYVLSLLSALPILILFYFSKQFYVDNPEYKVHSMWELTYSFQRIKETFTRFDRAFKYLTPVFWFANWWVVPGIFIVGIALIKKNWKMGTSLILSVLFVLFSLGINKVEEGVDSVFFSASRMFLALPLVLALSFSWFIGKKKYSNKIVFSLMLLSIFMVALKLFVIHDKVIEHTTIQNYGPVSIQKVEVMEGNCQSYQKIIEKYKVDLVLFTTSDKMNVPIVSFLNYGCPLINKKFPLASMLQNCKKNNQYQQLKNDILETILIANYNYDINTLKKSRLNCEIVNEIGYCVVIKNHSLTVPQICKKLGVEYARKD